MPPSQAYPPSVPPSRDGKGGGGSPDPMHSTNAYGVADAARVDRKYALKEIFTDPGEATDETGLAHFIGKRRAMQNQNDPTLRRAA